MTLLRCTECGWEGKGDEGANGSENFKCSDGMVLCVSWYTCNVCLDFSATTIPMFEALQALKITYESRHEHTARKRFLGR